MNARVVLALLFLVGGGLIAFAGAQPEAALSPSQAIEEEGSVLVKGVVTSVDHAAGTATLSDADATLRLEASSLPSQVAPEKSLVVEGTLEHRANGPVLVAEEIQVGCPSSYEA